MSHPSLSLVLATVGRVDEIARFLDALQAQTHPPSFELIFVDQNQDDRLLPSVKRAQVAGIDVHHLRQKKANLSAARNAGIAHARGTWVAFPDDDCWYEPDALSQVWEEIKADPALHGLSIDWVEQSASRGGPSEGTMEAAAWRRFRAAPASSITVFFNTHTLREVGSFDDRLGVGQTFGSGEEVDLLMRILNAGAKVKYTSRAKVHHHFGPPPRRSLSETWHQTMARERGTGALWAKHRVDLAIQLRGMLGPWLNAMKSPSLQALVRAASTCLGRLQGRWIW